MNRHIFYAGTQSQRGRRFPLYKGGAGGFLYLILFLFLTHLLSAQTNISSQKIHAIRLLPGDDIRDKLTEFVKDKKIHAGYIITCVGSLKQATLRLSNRNETQTWKETFEITSLTGTLSPDGNHIHISIADKDGKTIGGHLMGGSIVYTTAEIVIGEAPELNFTREQDSVTNLKELKISKGEDGLEHVNKQYPK